MTSYHVQSLDDQFGSGGDCAKDDMRSAYEFAKKAKVGAEINCPVCDHAFTKRSYQQAFCSNNRKLRGGRNCKDRYHNIMTPRGLYGVI